MFTYALSDAKVKITAKQGGLGRKGAMQRFTPASNVKVGSAKATHSTTEFLTDWFSSQKAPHDKEDPELAEVPG